MINPISTCIESIRFRYNTSSSERFIKYLRDAGVSIGEGVTFYEPRTVVVDTTRPCLVTIGNNVGITRGVVIWTHAADWHVLRELYGRPFGSAGGVTIKDNVFLGTNSILLKGVTIHENCIIGAGSVVTRDVPPGSVAAGNPMRVIMTMEEYYKKREEKQVQEASEYARAIYERYNRQPVPEDFKEFFDLFLERDPAKFGGIPVRKQVGRHYRKFMSSQPVFRSFEEFLGHSGIGGRG
ncbi:MAG: Galactoside O-acetyltransferase [Syntrophorhabdaceae bacterium PtaU1.Bin034]|nr:MAG: Galactoside O-acetyltransferase [Syntrophorhabdaceae bacterium PtaU1.Bin034]